MDDPSLMQQFKINAMHGHDVGVWVCEGSGLSISPCLFMQALCPDPAPRSLYVKWKPSIAPPQSFRRSGTLPLTYSECGRIPPWPYHLHLFAPQAPITRSLERESRLSDWSFAVPLVGVIVIFDQKYDRPASLPSLNQLLNRSKSPKSNGPLAWVRAQQLPYVVAALGYDKVSVSEQQFRSRHEITADIPVLQGPALADARARNTEASSMFSSVFDHQQLAFDKEYARAILGVLFKLVESKR